MSGIEDNFSEYMTQALYGPEGFYTQGGGAGRDRDYITSPEVGDLFGYVVAAYIDDWYDSLDVGGDAIVLEVGCGPGSLAVSIARAPMRNASNIDYRLVDISPVHRETAETKLNKVAPRFSWSVHESIPQCDVPTLVIANELLDNLVFDIGRTGDVYKAFETDRINRSHGDVEAYWGRFGNIDLLQGADAPRNLDDFRIPLHVGIADWFGELINATRNVSDLSILFFDYMKSVTNMKDENWLRLYSNNQRVVGVENVLRAINSGAKGDITTDVTAEDMHVLLDAEGFSKITLMSQDEWLRRYGIDDYCADYGQTSSYDQLQQFTQGNTHQATTVSFMNERLILTDGNGLGAFGVISARRAI